MWSLMMRDLISSLAPIPLAGPLQGTVGAGLVYTNYDSGQDLEEEVLVGLSSPPTTSEGSPCPRVTWVESFRLSTCHLSERRTAVSSHQRQLMN